MPLTLLLKYLRYAPRLTLGGMEGVWSRCRVCFVSSVRSSLELVDRLRVTWSSFGERQAMAAEILFLRRQLALFEERGQRPRRLRPNERFRLASLSRWVRSWREALVVVRPETLIRLASRGLPAALALAVAKGRPAAGGR